MKNLIKRTIIFLRPAIIAFFSLFFERKYLAGRHFDPGFSGYIWSLRAIWQRNILRLAKPLPFPAGFGCSLSNPDHINFHPDDLNNFQTNGTYFQNFAGNISIGYGCYIAPNVGLVTANHDPIDLDKHFPAEDVILGEHCWIGMNSVVLPGVTLGPRTTVAAGSVVTKSFPDGYCILAGTPAKVIRALERPPLDRSIE